MKKQILSLGKALSKTEQKLISGGFGATGIYCSWDQPPFAPCPEGAICVKNECYFR